MQDGEVTLHDDIDIAIITLSICLPFALAMLAACGFGLITELWAAVSTLALAVGIIAGCVYDELRRVHMRRHFHE